MAGIPKGWQVLEVGRRRALAWLPDTATRLMVSCHGGGDAGGWRCARQAARLSALQASGEWALVCPESRQVSLLDGRRVSVWAVPREGWRELFAPDGGVEEDRVLCRVIRSRIISRYKGKATKAALTGFSSGSGLVWDAAAADDGWDAYGAVGGGLPLLLQGAPPPERPVWFSMGTEDEGWSGKDARLSHAATAEWLTQGAPQLLAEHAIQPPPGGVLEAYSNGQGRSSVIGAYARGHEWPDDHGFDAGTAMVRAFEWLWAHSD
jgi:hypothetical protein